MNKNDYLNISIYIKPVQENNKQEKEKSYY